MSIIEVMLGGLLILLVWNFGIVLLSGCIALLGYIWARITGGTNES